MDEDRRAREKERDLPPSGSNRQESTGLYGISRKLDAMNFCGKWIGIEIECRFNICSLFSTKADYMLDSA
jgi:hypothetical protein